jgi:hypothetical protein
MVNHFRTDQRILKFVKLKAVEMTFVGISASLLILVEIYCFLGSTRGLDFTDEGLSLLSAKFGNQGFYFHSPFGFVTNKLFVLSDNNIQMFRLVGVTILSLVSYRFTTMFMGVIQHEVKSLEVAKQIRNSAQLLGTSLIVLSFYSTGMFTPSYNWLNLVSVLLGFTGILRVTSSPPQFPSKSLNVGLFEFCLGFGLSMYAKPTTTFVLAISFGCFIVNEFRSKSRIIFAKSGKILFFVLAGFATLLANPRELLNSYKGGYQVLTEFQPIYSFRSSAGSVFFGTLNVLSNVWLCLPIFLFLFYKAFIFAVERFFDNRLQDHQLGLKKTLTGGAFLISLAYFLKYSINSKWSGASNHYGDLPVGALTIGMMMIASSAIYGDKNFRIRFKTIFIMALICLCYGFGSSNRFIPQLTGVTGIILLTLIIGSPSKLTFPSEIYFRLAMTVIICASLLINSLNNPYRMEPLLKQKTVTELGENYGSLKLDSQTAQHLKLFRLATANMTKESRVLDLTGTNPSLVFLSKGIPIHGLLLTIGGYATSLELAKLQLNRDKSILIKNQDLWLITATSQNERNKMYTFTSADTILDDLGINLSKDFVSRGEFNGIQIWQSKRKINE